MRPINCDPLTHLSYNARKSVKETADPWHDTCLSFAVWTLESHKESGANYTKPWSQLLVKQLNVPAVSHHLFLAVVAQILE